MGRLGYSSITLTDLTETLPIFLTLESNLSNNIQKKNGSLYTPDFRTGDGVIITPSLFVGAKKESLIKDIYYIVDGNEYHTVENEIESGSIGINSQGQLVIKENISHSYEISACIDNFTIGEHGYSTDVKSRNRISIFVLEESSTYTAAISSNREHFDENNTSDIVLTAQFYKGTEEVVNATYVWDGLTDDDSSSTDNINGNGNTLTLSRAQIKGTEVISCTMTDPSTGLSFVATKIIRDYVDEYRADLLPSSSLILTPNNPSVELTTRVWSGASIINEGHTFSYEWKLIKSDGTSIILLENTNLLNIDITSTFPKENFTIACTITIDGKTAASAYQNIIYSPIEYTVNIEPKQVWLNVDNNGNYSGDHTFNFKFQLLDKEKNLILRENNDGFISQSPWSASVSTEDKWDYDLTLTIDNQAINSNEDSRIFEFKYQYLGREFSEEVYVIKNYAGKDGGVGYTIDLSNSFHTFAGEQAHAVANQNVSFQIQAYYGDQPLLIENVEYENVPTGLNVSYNATNQTVTMTTQSGDFLTEDGSIVFTITVKKKDGIGTLKFIKVFNYSINYNGKSYFLSFGDNNTITYSPATKTYNPSSIVVKAYSRNINGEASVYTEGIIYYSFDKENWTRLTKESVSNYSNIDNIYFRLYSPQMKSSNLEENSVYLLDEETIPVLTSLDGVEIGGDNLLRWTRTMPIENNKWRLEGNKASSYITQRLDGDFTCTVFDKSPLYSYIITPKERNNNEYINKTFCFSCYVKINNIKLETNAAMLALQLRLYEAFSDTTRAAYKMVGELSNRGSTYPKFIYDEELVENKWIKIYTTFTWKNFSDNSGKQPEGFDTTGGSYPYFSLSLYSGSDSPTSTIEIKKPKLEFGNIPTEWSASPDDVTYENIVGVNLLSYNDSYMVEGKNVEVSFPSVGKYTVSWSNSANADDNSSNSSFSINITKDNASFSQIQKIPIGNFYSFTLEISDFNNKIYYLEIPEEIILYYLKIEKGEVATQYFLEGEQISTVIQSIREESTQLRQDYEGTRESLTSDVNVIVQTINGDIQTSLDDLKADIESLSGSYVTIDSLNGLIHAQTSDFLMGKVGGDYEEQSTYIHQLQKAVTIDTSSEGEPFIQISTLIGDQTEDNPVNFFTKITSQKMSFIQNNEEVAYISNNALQIKKAYFLNSFIIGNEDSGELQVSVTETGIGFIWG